MSNSIGQQMQQLYQQFGELAGVTIELHKELLAVRVVNQQASATVFLQGAQLSHYQRAGEAPIIWCSEHCSYQLGRSLRGGIPVCWPWFGDLNRNPAQVQQQIPVSTQDYPAHGFVRNRIWQLDAVDIINQNLTRLTLSLQLASDEEPLWPFATTLKMTIDVGKSLNVEFAVSNDSAESVSFSSALHSYFAVSNIDHVAVNGLDQLPYIDCMDNWSAQQQQGDLMINKEVDRIYQQTSAPIRLLDKAGQRQLALHSQGSNSAILWNPWQEKSKRLSEFGDQDYQKMLCIETANAATDAITLAAGSTHYLTVNIS